MERPNKWDYKYSNLSFEERERQYERDLMQWEQTEAINETNRLEELRIQQDAKNAEMLREQQERNMQIMQQRYEEEQERQEIEKQEQANRDRYEKMARKIGIGLDYEDICEFMDDLYNLTYDQQEQLRTAEIEYDKMFYTEDILNDLKMCEDLKYKIQSINDTLEEEINNDQITVKRIKYELWRNNYE